MSIFRVTDLGKLARKPSGKRNGCPWQWHLRCEEGLVPLDERPDDARNLGTGVHEGLQCFYELLQKHQQEPLMYPQPSYREAQMAFEQWRARKVHKFPILADSEQFQDQRKITNHILAEYCVRQYNGPQWQVMEVESDLYKDFGEHSFGGKIDLAVTNDAGRLLIVDHKTKGKKLHTEYDYRLFDPDWWQMHCYAYLWAHNHNGQWPWGFGRNEMLTENPTAFRRFTTVYRAENLEYVAAQIEYCISIASDIDSLKQTNPTNLCNWCDYGGSGGTSICHENNDGVDSMERREQFYKIQFGRE